MAKVFFEIDNLNEVLDSFKKMETDARSILHTAVNEGAEYLAPLIKSNIPISNMDDIHLRDSINISKAKPKKTLKQSTIIRVGKKSASYGFHLETGANGSKPQPFMRATTDRHQEQVADIVGNEILDRLGL